MAFALSILRGSRIKFPDDPGGFGTAEGRTGTPSHGIGITPDGKSLWVNSTAANAVFKYSLPDPHLVGFAALPLVHPLGRPASGSFPSGSPLRLTAKCSTTRTPQPHPYRDRRRFDATDNNHSRG